MKNISYLIAAALSLALPLATFAADEAPPGALELPAGYKHELKQGIDSRVGAIVKADGLTINYDIGRVSKPGLPMLGGDFTDQAKRYPAAMRKWYKEQKIGGQNVHVVHAKDGMLIASFPDTGANFGVAVKNDEELAEALLIILSYAGPAKVK